MKRVAIQGGLGAYHGIAAENFLREKKWKLYLVLHLKIFFLLLRKILMLLESWLLKIPLPGACFRTMSC